MTDLADFRWPWGDAFSYWHNTGDKSRIVKLLYDGEPLSRDDGILLAAIVSGEWKRPKMMRKGFAAEYPEYIQNECMKIRVTRLKNRIARESKRKGLGGAPYREALEAIAPRYDLSADGLDKRIRKTKRKKTSPTAHKLFLDAIQEILAKSR